MLDELFERAGIFLPNYLTPQDKESLYQQISAFPNNTFYLPPSSASPEFLQGDAWKGFVALNFESGVRREAVGLILSNSCDVAPENPRKVPAHFLFAPLISVRRYGELLVEAGESSDQISSTLDAIRRQRVTSIFYLPDRAYGTEEAIVRLDDIHVHPAPDFVLRARERVLRLDLFAFYLLLLKLSIHFCRSHEGVRRSA
jgi:hypothetical protein